MKSRLHPLPLVVLGIVLATTFVRAECIGGPTLEDDFARDTAVFVGRAVSQRVVGMVGITSGRYTETTFEVEEVWKGNSERTQFIRTCGGVLGNEAIECGESVRFTIGARYVVFAVGERLETNSCQPTRTLDQAEKVLNWLASKPSTKLTYAPVAPQPR